MTIDRERFQRMPGADPRDHEIVVMFPWAVEDNWWAWAAMEMAILHPRAEGTPIADRLAAYRYELRKMETLGLVASPWGGS